MEALQLHLGCNTNPLSLPLSTWGHLAPASWIRFFWESLEHFEVRVETVFKTIPLPRQFDHTIMSFVLTFKPLPQTLRSINRCRIFKCGMFLSDLATADGRRLEEFGWDRVSSVASTYKFPTESPITSDWECWTKFWQQVTDDNGILKSPVGKWLHPSHRQWLYG